MPPPPCVDGADTKTTKIMIKITIMIMNRPDRPDVAPRGTVW
jgi:hypothetical protein